MDNGSPLFAKPKGNDPCLFIWTTSRCLPALQHWAPCPPPPVSVEGVLLIIVCIGLVAVVGLTAYMVLRLRRINVSADAYGSLQGKFNELGQMA